MIAALDRLQGLPGRAGYVQLAARAKVETQAQFYQEGAELMAIFHRTQAPLARLLPEVGGAGALTADNRVLQILNVDYMVWTPDLADHADRITAHARADFPSEAGGVAHGGGRAPAGSGRAPRAPLGRARAGPAFSRPSGRSVEVAPLHGRCVCGARRRPLTIGDFVPPA